MSIQSQNQLPHSPEVRYMQAPAFFGSPDIPHRDWAKVLGFVVVASLIGIFIGMHLIDNYVYADRKHAAAVEEMLASVERQPIPVLSDHRGQNSTDLRASLEQAGLMLVDNPIDQSEDSGADALDVDKMPASVDPVDINAAQQNGVMSLPAEKAAAFLSDYWNLTLYRSDATDLKVKYCLFGPTTAEQAIVQAVETQGWQSSSLGETGIDQVGNTYQHGTIDLDGHQYRWSVYACPLSEVYAVTGLPDSAWYISSRLVG